MEIRHLGMSSVCGRRRFPSPAASIIAFMDVRNAKSTSKIYPAQVVGKQAPVRDATSKLPKGVYCV